MAQKWGVRTAVCVQTTKLQYMGLDGSKGMDPARVKQSWLGRIFFFLRTTICSATPSFSFMLKSFLKQLKPFSFYS
jgi:hypothetical protein